MKLKTLKDFDDLGDIILNIKNLKAEAVKWVHVHRDGRWNWTEDTWRDFFNITEEDLK